MANYIYGYIISVPYLQGLKYPFDIVYDSQEKKIIHKYDIDYTDNIGDRYRVLKAYHIDCCGNCEEGDCDISYHEYLLSDCSWHYALSADKICRKGKLDSKKRCTFILNEGYWKNSQTGEKIDVKDKGNLLSISNLFRERVPRMAKLRAPQFSKKEREAIRRFSLGEPFNVSEFIDEDTIIAGYGSLNIDFEFPLPIIYIKQIYGTTSWSEYFKKKLS